MNLKIIKITSFYKPFLNYYYGKYPFIVYKDYNEQYDHLISQKVAWSNYFQTHMTQLGYEVFEVIYNAEPLQLAWAKEYGKGPENPTAIVLQQIKAFQPDIVFFQDTLYFDTSFYQLVRSEVKSVRLLFGHCCSPFNESNLKSFSSFNFMLACSPAFQHSFSRHGIQSYLFYHGFEHTILDKIIIDPQVEKSVVFIGSFEKTNQQEFHDQRLKLVTKLLESSIPLKVYSQLDIPGFWELKARQSAFLLVKVLEQMKMQRFIIKQNSLKKASLLTKMPEGPTFSDIFLKSVINRSVYGLEMYQLLSHHIACLNIHGGIAGDYAANMRMFESTGVGTLLITDYKRNISDLFEPGQEIITYSSVQDCYEKLKWVFDHPVEARDIADAGQRRTLKDHTIEKRAALLNEIIQIELKK